MITVDQQILDKLRASSCFGIAHDATVPECKKCDVAAQCKAKSEGALDVKPPTEKPKAKPAPEAEKPKTTTSKPKAEKAASAPKADKPKTTAKPNKPAAEVNPNLPDFKPMSLDELKELAVSKNVTWVEYDSPQITRMRLIMNLKKAY